MGKAEQDDLCNSGVDARKTNSLLKTVDVIEQLIEADLDDKSGVSWNQDSGSWQSAAFKTSASNRESLAVWLESTKTRLQALEEGLDVQVKNAEEQDPEEVEEIKMDPWDAFYKLEPYFDLDYTVDLTLNSALSMQLQNERWEAKDRQTAPFYQALKRNWKIAPAGINSQTPNQSSITAIFEKQLQDSDDPPEIVEHTFEFEYNITKSQDPETIKKAFLEEYGMGMGDDGLEYDFMDVYKKPLLYAGLSEYTDYLDKDLVVEYVNQFLLAQKVETHLSEPGNFNILRGLIPPLEYR